jgi:hypothetical protein
MAITYDVPSDTITVIGYTEAIPCTLNDISLADTAGGWGQVSWSHGTFYYLSCRLKIGDGSTETWFADEGQVLKFADNLDVTWSRFCISGETNSHIRFGKLVNDSKKITSLGCRINFGNNTACIGRNGALTHKAPDVQIYSSTLTGNTDSIQNVMAMDGKVYNSIGERVLVYKSIMSYYNVYMSRPVAIATCWSYPAGTFDKIDIHNYDFPIYVGSTGSGTVTFKNPVLKGNNYVARFEGSSYTINLVNPDIDNWLFLWQGGSSSARLNRQYNDDVKVIEEGSSRTPIIGATVKIWDSGSNLVTDTTTDANGEITQQTLNFGYYKQSTGNIPTMLTPHKIEVSLAGYETFVKYMYMDYKRKEVIMLRKSKPVKLCDDRLVLQVCSETEKDDRFIYTELV